MAQKGQHGVYTIKKGEKKKKWDSSWRKGNSTCPIWDPEEEHRAPAVGVNQDWETRDAATPCAVHVWLSR